MPAAAWLAAAALAPSLARSEPPPTAPVRDDTPSPAAVALVAHKCVSCHAMPAPVSRSRWGSSSVAMHVRRVAMSRQDWALVREYLGDASAGPDR